MEPVYFFLFGCLIFALFLFGYYLGYKSGNSCDDEYSDVQSRNITGGYQPKANHLGPPPTGQHYVDPKSSDEYPETPIDKPRIRF